MKLPLPSLHKQQHCIASNTEKLFTKKKKTEKFNTIETSKRLNLQITVIFMRSCENERILSDVNLKKKMHG